MKILTCVFFVLILASCSSPTTRSEKLADSTAVIDAPAPTAAQLADEVAHAKAEKEQRARDSISAVMNNMAFNPLTVSTVKDLKDLFKSLSITYTTPEDYYAKTFAFDSSSVSIRIYEASEGGGEAVCKADIRKNGFPLQNGLTIGITKEELFKLTGWKEEDFSHYESDPVGLRSIQFTINPSGDPYSLSFYIDDSRFAGIKFTGSCGMNP